MDRGVIYGEPVTRLRVEASLANNVLKISSASAGEAGGELSASGSYDFSAKTFALNAHGSGIDIAQIGWVSRRNLEVAGKLSASITGSGSLDDPRLTATVNASALTLSGQQFGGFEVTAHTASHSLIYNATTQLQGADLRLQGQTEMRTGYVTKARLEFSRFNIGALFRMAHVDAFTADSALAGTVTIDGPLADLKQLRGEAQPAASWPSQSPAYICKAMARRTPRWPAATFISTRSTLPATTPIFARRAVFRSRARGSSISLPTGRSISSSPNPLIPT